MVEIERGEESMVQDEARETGLVPWMAISGLGMGFGGCICGAGGCRRTSSRHASSLIKSPHSTEHSSLTNLHLGLPSPLPAFVVV